MQVGVPSTRPLLVRSRRSPHLHARCRRAERNSVTAGFESVPAADSRVGRRAARRSPGASEARSEPQASEVTELAI